MKKNYVPDGCFLVARMIFDSAIWRDDPHVLKLFIYLIGNARHKSTPKKYPSFEIKRGELVTSLAKISEENEYQQNGTMKSWARMKVSRMLDLLEKQGYIKKLCDTYGTHISICNYDIYQDLNNYKCDTDETQLLQDCYGSVTEVGINNNGINEKKEKNDKNKHIDFPEWVPIDEWNNFVKMRKSIKKPLTDDAIKLAIKKLDKLRKEGNDPKEVLNQSIFSSWQGLFPLKEHANNQSGPQYKEI